MSGISKKRRVARTSSIKDNVSTEAVKQMTTEMPSSSSKPKPPSWMCSWNCTKCTLQNEATSSKCVACATARPPYLSIAVRVTYGNKCLFEPDWKYHTTLGYLRDFIEAKLRVPDNKQILLFKGAIVQGEQDDHLVELIRAWNSADVLALELQHADGTALPLHTLALTHKASSTASCTEDISNEAEHMDVDVEWNDNDENEAMDPGDWGSTDNWDQEAEELKHAQNEFEHEQWLQQHPSKLYRMLTPKLLNERLKEFVNELAEKLDETWDNCLHCLRAYQYNAGKSTRIAYTIQV